MGVDEEYGDVVAFMPGGKRTDSGSRVINASPETIFRALIDPKAIVQWRPPTGMSGEVHSFDGREGGKFRMTWHYADAHHDVAGKSSEHSDTFEGRFLQIAPPTWLVEEVTFDSGDPAFAEPMTITTTLTPVSAGTRVSMALTNVSDVVDKADHQQGIESSLANLAAFTERARLVARDQPCAPASSC